MNLPVHRLIHVYNHAHVAQAISFGGNAEASFLQGECIAVRCMFVPLSFLLLQHRCALQTKGSVLPYRNTVRPFNWTRPSLKHMRVCAHIGLKKQ